MNEALVWFAPAARIQEGIGIVLEQSGFFQQTKPRKKVGIKVHFGEANNKNHIDPEFVRSAALAASFHNLQPVIIETTSLYRGRRQRASEHVKLAHEHGFTAARTLAPIDILDGKHGEKFYAVPLNSPLVATAYLATGLRHIRYLINIAHFKGHFVTGFGGALKNLAMGLAAKAGKLAMHSSSRPYVDEERCTSCGTCVNYCPHKAINFINFVAAIGRSCVGCGGCIAVCPYGAIKINWNATSESVQKMMAEYCRAVLQNRVAIHFNCCIRITPNCDCYPNTENPLMPDIGLFASFDPVACDQAAFDAARGPLTEYYPHLNPEVLLAHAEALGLGNRRYKVIRI